MAHLYIIGINSTKTCSDESMIEGYMTLDPKTQKMKYYDKEEFFETCYISENTYKAFNLLTGEISDLEVYYLENIPDSFFLKTRKNTLLQLPNYPVTQKRKSKKQYTFSYSSNAIYGAPRKSQWY